MKQLILLLTFLILLNHVFTQTFTNVEKLEVLSAEYSEEWDRNMLKVREYCLENNIPDRKDLENGRIIQMVNVDDGIPQYYVTFNLGAAQTTRADELWPGGNTGIA